MTIRMTDELCHRCDNHLASSNHNRDRLCGECQREIASGRGQESAAYRDWIARGQRREIYRHGSPSIAALKLPDRTEDLVALVERATAEIARRRQEAEAILRLLSPRGADQEEAQGTA
jgi:hypothetical protein